MDLSQQKRKFSDACLQAVAAAAGYSTAVPDPDDDSIDWILLATGANGTPRRPRLEVQLKCTARNVLHGTDLRFPLELKNYNDLREADVLAPRILVVMIVPDILNEWLMLTEQEMTLRYCLYWVSLRGMAATANEDNVTVRLPRQQAFTPDALQQIMRRINDGGLP